MTALTEVLATLIILTVLATAAARAGLLTIHLSRPRNPARPPAAKPD